MAMEWVKSTTGYYRLTSIATGSDALEVMFKRGDALAGEIEQGGFIPDAMIPQLCRGSKAQAKKLADQLVKTGLWARVRGGYLIVDWPEINAELVVLHNRRKRDRERKRAERAASRDMSVDASVDGSTDGSVDEPADSPADCPVDSLLDHQRKSKKKNAAAAAPAGQAPDGDLPPAVAILRSGLDAHKLTVRWDRLTTDELAEIEALVETHGDAVLIKAALAAYQPNKPPVYAKAWLGGWRALPAPGRLGLVRICDVHGTKLTPAGVCTSCTADALATPKENR